MSFKIWIFGFSDVLDGEQVRNLHEKVNEYLAGWNAHGAMISSTFKIVRNQFLVIQVNDQSEQASGCSIDALHQMIRNVASSFSLSLFDENNIVYCENGKFCSCSREEFKKLVRNAKVSSDTIVADLSIRSISDTAFADSEMFLKPAAVSWHGKAFFG